ncbi:hypothetical protein Tco_1363062 [Tanacetum coccineum]
MGLLKTNPGSTVKLDIEEVLGAKTYFKRFCFKAMKDGWTEGCRKVIGLDLERDYQGRVGLKEAVKEWLPLAEHRQCARHIYANLKKSWPGLHFKSLFWGAASATLKHVFDEKMRLLSNLNDHAHKWLVERDPNTWSRAFFQMDRSCGAFENRICESYHAVADSVALFSRAPFTLLASYSLLLHYLIKEEDADHANADHANANHANADHANADHENADPVNVDHANTNPEEMEHVEMEHVEMEEPMHMEEPMRIEEPVQEPVVQEPVLRRGLRLRRPSQRILLNKWKKPFQFDEHGTGSTA